MRDIRLRVKAGARASQWMTHVPGAFPPTCVAQLPTFLRLDLNWVQTLINVRYLHYN